MLEESPSPEDVGTAFWIAAARAQESERADRLFTDPYAEALAGSIGRAALAASERASGGENPFLPIRTRFFDDLLVAEAERLDQVVLLGAGLDTRAFRIHLPAHLRWFELDRAGILGHKEQVLAGLGAVARCSRSVVAADLSGDWREPLVESGFEVGLRTGWLAEGLLFYLSEAAVHGIAAEAGRLSGAGSLIAADVFGSGLLTLPSMQPAISARAQRGQPPPFTTDDPVGTFKRTGWSAVELTSPGRLAVDYGRPIRSPAPDSAQPGSTTQTYLVVARTGGTGPS